MNLSDLIPILQNAMDVHGDLATFIGDDILTTIQIEYDSEDRAICLILEADADDGEEIH